MIGIMAFVRMIYRFVKPNGMTKRLKPVFTITLIITLIITTVNGGITISNIDGIKITDTNGVNYLDPMGLLLTQTEGLLSLAPNGILAPTLNGITTIGAEGLTYLGAGLLGVGVKQFTANHADSIAVTAPFGFTMTNKAGQVIQAPYALVQMPDNITSTNIAQVSAIGLLGGVLTGLGSATVNHADGMIFSQPSSLNITKAQSVTLIGYNGIPIGASPDELSFTGADGLSFTGADGLSFTGADGLSFTGADGLSFTGADGGGLLSGIKSVDPELAILLNKLVDDSTINVAVVYHQSVTDSDIGDLQRIGILGGTRYRALPIVCLSGSRNQISKISKLPNVRSIYSNRTFTLTGEPGNGLTGTARLKKDTDLISSNSGKPLTGKGVAVAVLDTGLDATHPDLSGRVIKNVKFASTLGLGIGFNYPTNIEGIPDTDLVSGHGTFVAGIIGGNGSRSSGKYSGIAPGVNLVGLGAGDLSLLWILEGMDYLLVNNSQLGVRVLNCSFSAATVYDPNDPVNVATKMLVDSGINVVFSAGNRGGGMRTLNPYAMAPWVISVGATNEIGKIASFSSRGSFDDPNSKPTIVAPGVNVVSLKAMGINTSGLGNLLGSTLTLGLIDSLSYSVGSGTSFSAPQVSGTIALMLQANPQLTPENVKDILQRSASPMPPYFRHDVGAGMLNAHAAVLESAFPQRRMGSFRGTTDQSQIKFITNPVTPIYAVVNPGGTFTTSLTLPQNTILASVQVAWGQLLNLNNLSMQLTDPNGKARPQINSLNIAGLTGGRESDTLSSPLSGTWNLKVTNNGVIGGLLSTPQSFIGALDLIYAQLPSIIDLNQVSQTQQNEAYLCLRTLTMSPMGNHFFPKMAVTRVGLAEALIRSARIPQYLAAAPQFSDVLNPSTRLVVESVQSPFAGALFPDSVVGGSFQPNKAVTRLTAAVALVRAAGLTNSAQSSFCANLSVSDSSSIPCNLRGYVAVALSTGLLTADGGIFRSSDALTRSELAHALTIIMKRAT